MPGLRALWTVAWHVAGRRLSSAILLAGVCVPVLAQESVSLQLRWRHQFQFAGYYAALHQGFYREAGLDVTLKEGGPGTDVPAEVLAGRSEFGVGVSSLVIDYLKGKPVLLLGPIFQHSPNMLLLYGRDRHLTDLAGPAGGRVMLMRGGQDMELKAMFLNEGIALDKLRIVETGRHLDDFLERRIEALNAYVSNEPYILEQRDIPYTMLRPQTYGMDFYGDVLFTRRGLADERPEVVAAFRAASMRGWRYALDHPDEIVDLILRHYNTQNKTRAHLAYEARQVRRLINPEIIEIGHSNPGRWRHIADTYQKTGLVHAARPLEDFFYQPGRGVDLAWLYRALAVIGAIALVVGGRSPWSWAASRPMCTASTAVWRVPWTKSPAARSATASSFRPRPRRDSCGARASSSPTGIARPKGRSAGKGRRCWGAASWIFSCRSRIVSAWSRNSCRCCRKMSCPTASMTT